MSSHRQWPRTSIVSDIALNMCEVEAVSETFLVGLEDIFKIASVNSVKMRNCCHLACHETAVIVYRERCKTGQTSVINQ
jgi:hypothetical protein